MTIDGYSDKVSKDGRRGERKRYQTSYYMLSRSTLVVYGVNKMSVPDN
jgi:hypothetical protein